jgi:hypothetical protein
MSGSSNRGISEPQRWCYHGAADFRRLPDYLTYTIGIRMLISTLFANLRILKIANEANSAAQNDDRQQRIQGEEKWKLPGFRYSS